MRVLATHSIRQFLLHFPARASPCAITFQLESTSKWRGRILPFQKTFTGLGGMQSSFVTADVFETGMKCLVVHERCFHSYRLASLTPVPTTDNQSGPYNIYCTAIIVSWLTKVSFLSGQFWVHLTFRPLMSSIVDVPHRKPRKLHFIYLFNKYRYRIF